MSEEKMRILRLIQDKKVTAEEGMGLLEALQDTLENRGDDAASAAGKRFLRIRVTSEKGKKVNVNIPLGLLRIASKLVGMGMAFVPAEARQEMEAKGIDINSIDFDELIEQIELGLSDGKLIDVETEDEKEGLMNVQIYVD